MAPARSACRQVRRAGSIAFVMYHTYILQSELDRTFYIGMTTDIQIRLSEHNRGESRYTSTRKPWKLVYFETFDTLQKARQREKYFKSGAGRRFRKKNIASLAQWQSSAFVTHRRKFDSRRGLKFSKQGKYRPIHTHNKYGIIRKVKWFYLILG